MRVIPFDDHHRGRRIGRHRPSFPRPERIHDRPGWPASPSSPARAAASAASTPYCSHGANARVVVNDLGAGADAVAAEIVAAGGQAQDQTDADAVQAMVDGVVADWGRVDILVNNAGILRDKSFAKLDLADPCGGRRAPDGRGHCGKAVWELM